MSPHQAIATAVIIFLINHRNADGKKNFCPIGFDLSYTKYDKEPICYRLKQPELFTDKFEDCAGNLYTSKLYHNLNFTKPNLVLWAEYKSLYPGGPFIDWSYTSSTGNLLITTYDVKYDPLYGLDEELCVVIDPVGNFTANRCNERHHRYCFVKPYSDDDMKSEDCGELTDYWRFWSPKATCLTSVIGIGGTTVRATWPQAQEMCSKRGGSLLNRGWRYANNPLLHPTEKIDSWINPLGIETRGETLIWSNSEDGNIVVPDAEWNFAEEQFAINTSFVALVNDKWHLVNSSYIFYDVICERSIHLRNVTLKVTVDLEGKLTLDVNDTVDGNEIYCFSDSVIYYPTAIKITKDENNNVFILKPITDGHYWCIHVDSKNFRVTESNKALFVRDKQSVTNLYAIKIRLWRKYKFENLEKLYRVWEKKLKEYIFFRTKYIKVMGVENLHDPHKAEGVLKGFRSSYPSLSWKDMEVFYFMKLKRLYLDGRTALLHVQLSPDMLPVPASYWEDLEVVFMKPAYYCNGIDTIPSLPLGQSVLSNGCRNYTCIGDFNEGVQWVTTAAEGCTTPHPSTLTSVVIVDDNMDQLKPKESKPEDHLGQIMEDLELLLDDINPVPMDNIKQAFQEVDLLLEVKEDLQIPGQFLRLLDRLGAKADLNGSHVESAIRNNIAMVMADAGPETPVRGLRIATRDQDKFVEDAFQVIIDEINSTLLRANECEALVYLPESVTNSSRRISFVVFRTDRAFHSNRSSYPVNSRVLSVNVEDVTKFDHGEVIDIHLRPTKEDLERNISRSCAYWHFDEDGTGYWSQDGCTLIKSNRADILDTCRCTHLTHFAEILIPRTVFANQHENILEMISIVGCSLSLIGLTLVALTALIFRSWRREFSNKIWLQLCIAIFFVAISFLVTVFMKFDAYNLPCMLVGIALHYFVLASFCWMLVAAVLSYRRLVLVFTRDASHKLFRASAFSWGVPCAVVGILLSVAPHSYEGRYEEKSPNGAFCYPSGLALWLSVYTPIAVMLFANWTLFAVIVHSVFASRRIQRHGDTNEALRCASVSFLLVFLFGLPWIFGLFSQNIVAAYLFSITATLQGLVLFLFFVLGNKKTRDLWLNKLKIKHTRQVPVTSSTYTNKSSGGGWRTPGAATMEANSTKPRSLASSDNSRFS